MSPNQGNIGCGRDRTQHQLRLHKRKPAHSGGSRLRSYWRL